MDPVLLSLLSSFLGAALGAVLTRWLTRDWMKAVDLAMQFARREYFRGNRVRYRNSRWRRWGLAASLMVDVCGPDGGVYLLLINRDGVIRKVDRLPARYRPRC